MRVCAAMLSDLLVTALKERSTVPVRNGHLSVVSRVAARAMVAILLIAVTVAVASMVKTPQYEASIMILVGHKLEFEETRKNVLGLEQLTQTMAEAVGSRAVAEAVTRQEGLSARPEDFLEQGLKVEWVPETQFIEVVYTDTDPPRAQRVANTVGEVFSGKVSEVSRGANPITATLWRRAQVPEEAVSPNPLRNGLLALVSGLLLCVGLAFALLSVAASGIGRATLRTTRAIVGQPASSSRLTPTRAPATQAAKDKELLEALRRHRALTVAGVALETSSRWRMPTGCSRRWRCMATSRSPSSAVGCSIPCGKATLPHKG